MEGREERIINIRSPAASIVITAIMHVSLSCPLSASVAPLPQALPHHVITLSDRWSSTLSSLLSLYLLFSSPIFLPSSSLFLLTIFFPLSCHFTPSFSLLLSFLLAFFHPLLILLPCLIHSPLFPLSLVCLFLISPSLKNAIPPLHYIFFVSPFLIQILPLIY